MICLALVVLVVGFAVFLHEARAREAYIRQLDEEIRADQEASRRYFESRAE